MNEELRKRLIEDLKKSGLASEMHALKAFHRMGWRANAGGAYLDKDENRTREIDISASLATFLESDGEYYSSIFLRISAEIKKTEKPWIVFKRKAYQDDLLCAWNNLIFSINLPDRPVELTDSISRSSLVSGREWLGAGIHHAFKDPSTSSTWYKAFVSACKACEHSYAVSAEAYENWLGRASERVVCENVLDDHTVFIFFQPVVILDGKLISAELSESSEMLLEEVFSVPFEFEFGTKNYSRGSYRVDLVTLQGIEEYLVLMKQRHQDIVRRIHELSEPHLTEEC